MKEDTIEQKEKEFLANEKRLNEIRDIIRNSPWRKLDIPIQDGWNLFLKLTPEARRRDDGERMARALSYCDNGYKVSKESSSKISTIRKDTLLSKIRPLFTHTHTDGKTYYSGPSVSSLTEKKYERVEEDVKKFFTKRVVERVSRWGGQIHKDTRYELNIPEYYICVGVRKRILNMVQDIDNELLKEKAFLEDNLEEYWRSAGGKRYWRDEFRYKKRRHSKDAINKFMNGDIEDPSNYKKLTKLKK